jgi:hypothetical protein
MNMEGSVQRIEPEDDEKAQIHRRLFAEGQLTEMMMTGVALEALERADVDFFLEVTNVTRQSEDPEVLARTSRLLDTFADMATDAPPQQP